MPFAGIELTSQRVRGYMVPLSYRGDRSEYYFVLVRIQQPWAVQYGVSRRDVNVLLKGLDCMASGDKASSNFNTAL